MLHIVTKPEIETRVNGINLTMRRLASRAGVDPMTAYRGAKKVSTHAAIVNALQDEELKVFQHLMRLPHIQEALPHVRAALEADAAGEPPPSTALRDCA